MRETILITGSSGFIGSNVVDFFLDYYNLITPVRKESTHKRQKHNNNDDRLQTVEGDFYDENILNQIFSKNVDIVIHLAALRGETDKPWDEYKRINVEATKLLLEYSKKYQVKKFIYCSSVGVLGTIPAKQPAQNSDPVDPDNFYHQSKWEAEEIVRDYHTSNFQVCIVRPTITYGKGDDGFLPKLISMVKGKRFVFPSKPVYIHLLHVSSFVKLLYQICQHNVLIGGTYIVADKSPICLSDIVDRIYQNIHHRHFPRFFRVPYFTFYLAESILNLINNKSLKTSLQ